MRRAWAIAAWWAIAICLWGACQAQYARAEHEGSYEAAALKGQENKEAQPVELISIEQTSNGQPSETERQSKATDYTKDPPSWVEYLNAFSTFVIAAFTVLLFFAVRTQIRTTRDIERAWMLAAIGNFPEIPTNQNVVAIMFIWPHFTNSGRTPGRVTKIAMRQHQIPSSTTLPSEPAYQGEVSLDLIVAPGSPIHLQSGNLGITPEEFVKAGQGETKLYVYGFVDYVIVGKKSRQTRFCFVYHSPHGFDPTPRGFY